MTRHDPASRPPAVCPVCEHETLQIPGTDSRLCPRGHKVKWNFGLGQWVHWPYFEQGREAGSWMREALGLPTTLDVTGHRETQRVNGQTTTGYQGEDDGHAA
jgi:hypothetical protein